MTVLRGAQWRCVHSALRGGVANLALVVCRDLCFKIPHFFYGNRLWNALVTRFAVCHANDTPSCILIQNYANNCGLPLNGCPCAWMNFAIYWWHDVIDCAWVMSTPMTGYTTWEEIIAASYCAIVRLMCLLDATFSASRRSRYSFLFFAVPS